MVRHTSAMNGQLWVLDGADGVGKATQVALLVERLNQSNVLNGKKAHHIDFPHYQEKPWGVLTRQYLDGVFGPLESVGPYPASLLYAGDRGAHAAEMHAILKKGDWIICDRYVPSSMAFQTAKIDDAEEKERYVEWLQKTEYELFGIPKPDGVILLTLPLHLSQARTEARRSEARAKGEALNDKVGHTDIHEQNTDFMTKAMQEYVHLARRYKWHIIECAEGERELSREQISDQIFAHVTKGL